MNVRVDARDKVTGAVRYGDDRVPPGLLYARFKVATVAKGRITAIDTAQAEAVEGVQLVLTHLSDLGFKDAGFIMTGAGYAFQSLQPLTGDHIAYRGQIIAMAVADTPHAATYAASLVHVTYEEEPFSVELGAEGVNVVVQNDIIPIPEMVAGDADATLEGCEYRVDNTFDAPAQHAVPLEMHNTVCEWRDDTLVVHESTQNAGSVQFGLARMLGIAPEKVEVISPYTGGGFGNRNSLQSHTPLVALASQRLGGRPVKALLTRPQGFHNTSFRPATHHRVALGLDKDGILQAGIYEVDQQTSRHDLFPGLFAENIARAYGYKTFRSRTRLIQTDVQSPGFMRSPYEHTSEFALETSIDELAYQAGIDPVELRIRNEPSVDPIHGKPYSSRRIVDCLRIGAEKFNWDTRIPEPGRMVSSDGHLIGMGVATGIYPSQIIPVIARVYADAQGGLRVEAGGHEMGQGLRSAVLETVVRDLGIPRGDVSIVLGDSRTVPQHLTAGSWGTASAVPAIQRALRELRSKLGLPETGPVDLADAVTAAGGATVMAEGAAHGHGQPDAIYDRLRTSLVSATGPDFGDFVSFSHAAHFVEVRIEPGIRRIRVHRVVSVIDCGRVVSPVTAASQVRGGVIWGLSGTLREAAEVDPRYGGWLNSDMAEYAIAVNLDVRDLDVHFVNEPDYVLTESGAKGVGEVSMCGVSGAIANAVFHATGYRARTLPIRLEDVL